MSVQELPLEELELLSFADIAYQLIKENKAAMNTADVFKTVCKLRKIKKAGYEAKIADFFTMLTTDKRFVLLSTGEWDLKELHTAGIEINKIIEEDIIEDIEEEAKEETEVDKDIELLVDISDEDLEDDPESTGLEDLVIVTEDELEEE